MTPDELTDAAGKLAHSLGIRVYIRDGRIYQHGPGREFLPPTGAIPAEADVSSDEDALSTNGRGGMSEWGGRLYCCAEPMPGGAMGTEAELISTPMPVDELATWKQLTCDRRLSDALAECDARDWDALPLAQKELSRLFPHLWETTKAAERWLARNPLAPLIHIIRVWGGFVDYKPKRQRRWSRALVRHGANGPAALAAVLGERAEDVMVRDHAGSARS